MRKRWGYKGTETAVNGLTLWMEKNLVITGNADQRYIYCCRHIVNFAIEYIPDFKKRGHLQHSADYVAKQINSRNMFQQFTHWLKTQPDVTVQNKYT